MINTASVKPVHHNFTNFINYVVSLRPFLISMK